MVEGQRQVSHLGYQLSLRPGQPAGQDSPYPSMPKYLKDNVPDNLTACSSTPPDYSFPSLSYFESHDHLVYNPLGKLHKEYITTADNERMLSMAGSAPHSANSANAYHLAEEWSSASEEWQPPITSEKQNLQANQRSLTSSKMVLCSRSTRDPINIDQLADNWSSASEKNNHANKIEPIIHASSSNIAEQVTDINPFHWCQVSKAKDLLRTLQITLLIIGCRLTRVNNQR